MAVSYFCDGCGGKIEDAPHRFGVALKRDYCDACKPMIEEYLAGRDRAHTRAAEKYQEKMGATRTAFVMANPEAKLPDE